MSRCLCCNKEIRNPSDSELKTGWHDKCVKRFFGTTVFPELDCSEKELEKLADRKSTRLNSSHNVASRMPSSA